MWKEGRATSAHYPQVFDTVLWPLSSSPSAVIGDPGWLKIYGIPDRSTRGWRFKRV